MKGVKGISLSQIHWTIGGNRIPNYPYWYVCKEVWFWLACQCQNCNQTNQIKCSYQIWEYGNGVLGKGFSQASIVTSGYVWASLALGQKLEEDEFPPASLKFQKISLPQLTLDELGKELAKAIVKGKYSVGFLRSSQNPPSFIGPSTVPGISTTHIVENRTWQCEFCNVTQRIPSRLGLLERILS